MAKLEGFYLAGTLEGFSMTPWTNNAEKFNYRVGISRSYEDKWGNRTKDVVEVDVSLEAVQVIQKQCDMLKGKEVMVRVVPAAKTGGRNGAWLSVYIPKGESIIPQNLGAAPAPVAADERKTA